MQPRKTKSSDSQSFRANSLEKTERRFTYKPMKRVEETYSQTQNSDWSHNRKIESRTKRIHQSRKTFIQQLKNQRKKTQLRIQRKRERENRGLFCSWFLVVFFFSFFSLLFLFNFHYLSLSLSTSLNPCCCCCSSSFSPLLFVLWLIWFSSTETKNDEPEGKKGYKDCGDFDGWPLDFNLTVERDSVSDRWIMLVEYDRWRRRLIEGVRTLFFFFIWKNVTLDARDFLN